MKIVKAADGEISCPDNINALVASCLAYKGQPELKERYALIYTKAIKNGWIEKTQALQSAEDALRKLEAKYKKLDRELDMSKAEVFGLKKKLKEAEQKAGKTSVLAAKKAVARAKGKETAPAIPTFQLPLPPAPEARMTTTAPKTAKPYVSHSESLLDQGVDILRSTEQGNWSDRAVSWLAMVETRPEIKFK
jgi:hypothetical protein